MGITRFATVKCDGSRRCAQRRAVHPGSQPHVVCSQRRNITTEARRTQRTSIIRVATLSRDGARRWELAAAHMVHTGTLHGVVCSVVLFILAARHVICSQCRWQLGL